MNTRTDRYVAPNTKPRLVTSVRPPLSVDPTGTLASRVVLRMDAYEPRRPLISFAWGRVGR